MKTTKRFENAVIKLYNAFHEGTLDAFNCKHCAVGNMCNNSFNWGSYADDRYITEKLSHKTTPTKEELSTGYNPEELANVEELFLYGVRIGAEGMKWNLGYKQNKELQFKGLCAVVEYLAELDNIPNPMGYSKLFETENNKPKYELQF